MKKLLLVGALFGSLNFAQAITIDNGTSLDGGNAYEFLVSILAGQNITGASIVFTGIQLTHSNGNGDDISYDIINRADANGTINDGDVAGDYFTSHTPYSTTTVNLGTQAGFVLNGAAQTWTYNFNAATLGTLNADAADGLFDIGIDPDCLYTVGSIVFNYTTAKSTTPAPDQSATVVLLGLTFVGLLAFRRKLCLN